MSFLGSVGKIFKKAVNVATRVGPQALAIGAVAFTAGAALGLQSMAGGWGGAVSGALEKLGLDGASGLGRVLTGAVTQAGYGAALGAGASLATGGSIRKGAQLGAAAGAATGAATGALTDWNTDPLASTGLLPDSAPASAGPAIGRTAPGGFNDNQYPNNPRDGTVFANLDRSANPSGGRAASASPGPVPGGTVPGAASWIERNQGLVGGAVGGIGQGLLALAKGEDEGKAAINAGRARQDVINSNYTGGGNGLLLNGGGAAAFSTQTPRPRRPEDKFDPATYGAEGGKWVYDPSAGRIRYLVGISGGLLAGVGQGQA